MSREGYKVFSEGRLAGLTLKNRLVRSATHEASMTEDGKVTDAILKLYRELALGGVGMIITGHMAVAPQGKASPLQTCIWDDSYIKEIAAIADAVHSCDNGCKILAQVSHGGRQVFHENDIAECVGPSPVPCPILKKRPRELSDQEIRELIAGFVKTIVRVKKAGFDGVQLHAAHGYLLSSFLSPYTNRRDDQYGGPPANRAAIIREIVSHARKEVGDFPILAKINGEDSVPGGTDIDNFPALAAEIEKAGIDAIEVSGGIWDCLARSEEELGFLPVPIPESRTRINSPEKQSYFLKYAEKLELKIPVILVGGNRNIELLEKIIDQGAIDFFSMARPLISEPGLPGRWLRGTGGEKADCVSCSSCLLIAGSGETTACMLKQNKLKQKISKSLAPYLWRMFFK